MMTQTTKKIIKTNEIIIDSDDRVTQLPPVTKNGDPNVSSYGYDISPQNKRQPIPSPEDINNKKDNYDKETTLSPKQQRQLRRLSKAFGLKTSHISIVSPDGIRRMIHPKYINYENVKRII
uniref:Uncharacterized protein n=1 Tax=Strongyloides venezuelensis TaxID=75913 RepID=A0A0K0G4A1_STRVS